MGSSPSRKGFDRDKTGGKFVRAPPRADCAVEGPVLTIAHPEPTWPHQPHGCGWSHRRTWSPVHVSLPAFHSEQGGDRDEDAPILHHPRCLCAAVYLRTPNLRGNRTTLRGRATAHRASRPVAWRSG